jgi:hypothetical protein
MGKKWIFEVVQIQSIAKTRKEWQWIPVPPPDVIKEFTADHYCPMCKTHTGVFAYIGQLQNGRWLAFRRPPFLARDGDLAAILEPVRPRVTITTQANTQEADPGDEQ